MGTILKAGLAKQASASDVMGVMKDVGIKITEGAKAFLYKEYIWLTIWSCSFAIVLGSTVDLLEMNMKRAPTNFPYTATSYLTGSMTSILAGYVGMRIAVYTNTRVTFTCCSDVHKGFITAFRGGQVLGFVLVGLAILNIMIIILLFKACWYNEFLDQVLASGRPIDHCPAGAFTTFKSTSINTGEVTSHTGVEETQKAIWAYFETHTYDQWQRNFAAAHPVTKTNTAADVTKATTDVVFKASSTFWKQTATTTVIGNTKDAMTAVECAKAAHTSFTEATHTCTTWTQGALCDLWTATT